MWIRASKVKIKFRVLCRKTKCKSRKKEKKKREKRPLKWVSKENMKRHDKIKGIVKILIL